MTVDSLSTTDPRWGALLAEVPHDVYHLPEYLEVSAMYEGTDEDAGAMAFHVRDEGFFCLIPLLIRRLPAELDAPADWRDARSPYGYAAPLFHGDSASVDRAVRAFTEECRNRNIVSAFIRMHPLLSIPPVLAEYGHLVKHGETVHVNLTLTEAALWSQTRERLRSYINRLQRAGFHVRFDDWSTYNDFVNVYGETMTRLQANRFYRFPAEYFRDLRVALSERLHLCSVFDECGEFSCGALLTENQGIVQYHLSGTAGRFLSLSPSKLMLHEIILWAKRAGHKILHLGGGLGGQADSLLHFKAGFSPLRSDFFTYRLVCDAAKYACLSQQIRPEILSEDYFPQYRSPADSSS
jgi:hypothetical protein